MASVAAAWTAAPWPGALDIVDDFQGDSRGAFEALGPKVPGEPVGHLAHGGSVGVPELTVSPSPGTSPQPRPSVGCASGPSRSWLTSWAPLGLELGSCSRSPSSTSTLRSS